jgi:anhydro-N-acetylmuramic acid kinase
MKAVKSIGLMSGTSIDGSISAALISTDGENEVQRLASIEYAYELGHLNPLRPIHHVTKAAELAYRVAKGDHKNASSVYPAQLKRYLQETFSSLTNSEIDSKLLEISEAFLKVTPGHSSVTLKAVIDKSTRLHVEAVEALLQQESIQRQEISFIGYHGQTLYHAPFEQITVQVGDPKFIADRTGIPVVYDFRSNDIANGGQGAPLAPVYHRALAKQDNLHDIAVLNLGGTANISLVSATDQAPLAFDTGPANALIDRWVKERLNQPFDAESQLAFKGVVNQTTLDSLLKKAIILSDGRNYLDLTPPKSLDIRDYHYQTPEFLKLSVEDGCATLNAFTAECIALGLKYSAKIPTLWVACGGGVKNPHLLKTIQRRVSELYGVTIEIRTADALGWSSAAMEAELIAFLAVRSARGLPITFPSTTGVTKPLTGGRLVTPA